MTRADFFQTKHHYPRFPPSLSHTSDVLSVSGLAGGRIRSLVHARSSTPVPILDSFTLVFFFFFFPQPCYSHLRTQAAPRGFKSKDPIQYVNAGTLCTQTSQVSLFTGILLWYLSPRNMEWDSVTLWDRACECLEDALVLTFLCFRCGECL